MPTKTGNDGKTHARLGLDFWKYFAGQLTSNLGTSFSMFALPLLVYKLTGSALNLGASMAVAMAPYLLFGLVIGAWVDRIDRKRLMIWVNVALAAVLASIPAVAATGHLSVWFIYCVEFVASTLAIAFNSSEFAAIPSLVEKANLVTANGRIQASYSAATVAGPILAGVMVGFVPLSGVVIVDSASYVFAAATLLSVRRSFNVSREKKTSSVRQDVMEGLRYVIGHPVLRNISIMMAMVNFVSTTMFAQLVLFAHVRLAASYSQIGWLFAAQGLGVVVLSLSAGALRRRWSFSVVALTALAVEGLLGIAFSFSTTLALALPLTAAMAGLGSLFNINTTSLRQSIVPNEMLGRVMSIAAVLAWSAIPIGSLLGGLAVQQTGNVVLVFVAINVVTFAIPIGFAFTALGRAHEYVPTTAVTRPTETAVETDASPSHELVVTAP